MARPKKLNADYFPHDAQMRNAPSVRAIRNKYGLEGYAVWCMLLECTADASNFTLEIDTISIEVLAGDFACDAELLSELIAYAARLKLVKIDGETLQIPLLNEGLQPLLSRRAAMQEKKAAAGVSAAKTGVSAAKTRVSAAKTRVSASKNPQSKVKESKAKEMTSNDVKARARKGTTTTPQSFEDFVDGLTPSQLDELQAALPHGVEVKTAISEIRNKAAGRSISNPAAYLRASLENFKAPRDIKKNDNERNYNNSVEPAPIANFGGLGEALADQRARNKNLLATLGRKSRLD